MSASIPVPEELIEAVAMRAAELVLERQGDAGGDADRWLRGADAIADYIAAPASRVYALASAGRIPVERDGSALLAKASALDAWIASGGGRRP